MCAVQILMALLMVSTSLPAAEWSLDQLLQSWILRKDPIVIKEVELALKGRPDQDVRIAYVVAFELQDLPRERIARLAPLFDGRREAAVAHPFMATSLADAFARAGESERAESVLALLSGGHGDLERAESTAVRALTALNRRQFAEAKRETATAHQMLAHVVSEPVYETWRSRLLRRRLQRIDTEIESSVIDNAAGPACLAWIQADRAGTAEAYQSLGQRFPKTLFADAGQIERAKLRLREGVIKEALALIDDPRLVSGSLASVALLLRGDIQLVAGRPTEAKKAFEEALTALVTPAALSGIDERILPYINPAQSLHQLNESGYIVWNQRPTGTILAPAAHRDTAAYLRYQILVRLAVLSRCGGDIPTAVALARAVMTFDVTDRLLDQQNKASGSSLLAHTCETGKFIMPLEPLDELSEHARILLWLGAAFYQVEDWKQASAWSLLAAERIPARQAVGVQTARALAAASTQLFNYDEALAIAAQVQLKPSQAPHRAWFVARLVEREIYSNRGQRELYMASQARLYEQAKGTEYASEALLAQAAYMLDTDNALVRRLLAQHEREFPNREQVSIQFLRDQMQEATKVKVQP